MVRTSYVTRNHLRFACVFGIIVCGWLLLAAPTSAQSDYWDELTGGRNDEFLFVGPPSISVATYQAVYCQTRHGVVSAACPYAPQMYQLLVDAGIDPVIELAFAAKETEFGTTGPGRAPQHNIHNLVCNGWDGGTCQGPYHGRFSTYSSYMHGIQAWITLILTKQTYVDAGNMTFREVLPIYAPSFENDTNLYIAQTESWVRGWRSWDTEYVVAVTPEIWGPGIRMPPPTLGDPRFLYGSRVDSEAARMPPPGVKEPEVPQNAIVVDDSHAGFVANQETWQRERCGLNNEHVATISTSAIERSSSRATWVPTLPAPGVYEVHVFIPQCGSIDATNSAHYVITHDGGTSVVSVDQHEHVGEWVSLGIYAFGARFNPTVEINDLTFDDHHTVRVDAAIWLSHTGDIATVESARYEGVPLPNDPATQLLAPAPLDGDVTPVASVESVASVVALPAQPTPTSPNSATPTDVLPSPMPPPTVATPRLPPVASMPGFSLPYGNLMPTKPTPSTHVNTPETSAHELNTIGVVIRKGSMRSTPRMMSDELIGMVCLGDEVLVLAEHNQAAHTWFHIRMLNLSADCAPNHVRVGDEGWVSSTLISGGDKPSALDTP